MTMQRIGILGGMGPLATADLFRKITLLTKASCDNDHIRVYIDSNAQILNNGLSRVLMLCCISCCSSRKSTSAYRTT